MMIKIKAVWNVFDITMRFPSKKYILNYLKFQKNKKEFFMKLKGKVALVTGAGSGIGKETALLFAKEGANVAVLSRTKEELEKVADQIKKMGHDALVLSADISKEDDIKIVYKEIIKKWNTLDILFANAGINGVWTPLEEFKLEDWQKTIDINLTGTFLTIKHAIPHLKSKGGSIVITSSVNGTRIFSNTGATAYSCTKASQVVMTKMLALELAKYKIRINAVCPGAIKTEIEDNTKRKDVEKEKIKVEFPEGKIPLTGNEPPEAIEVAKLVLFLSSDESNHITGSEVWIDGGQSLLKG
jgi:NAD(P)-dependent dehydrogenase (short-subunit alcohol dehydrogenase family)